MRCLPLGGLVLLAVLVGACGEPSSVAQLVSAEEAARKADLQVCAGAPGSPTDVAHEPDTWRVTGMDTWRTAEGCIVRVDAVSSIAGAAHCGWESVRFLLVGEPVGSLVPEPEGGATFVRDPQGVYEGSLAGSPVLDAALPADAVDTGFRQGTSELWVVPGDASGVYLRSPEGIERWPHDPAFSACE